MCEFTVTWSRYGVLAALWWHGGRPTFRFPGNRDLFMNVICHTAQSNTAVEQHHYGLVYWRICTSVSTHCADYPDWGFASFWQVRLVKCQDSSLLHVPTTPWHIFPICRSAILPYHVVTLDFFIKAITSETLLNVCEVYIGWFFRY
jgi:hypothetical protein